MNKVKKSFTIFPETSSRLLFLADMYGKTLTEILEFSIENTFEQYFNDVKNEYPSFSTKRRHYPKLEKE